MAQNPIQWFPGHMAKTRRVIKECLPQVDVVIELLDARIPYSSKNPEIEAMIEQKPHITLLTKATLADPDVSRRWADYYNKRGAKTVIIDSLTGYGMDALDSAIKEVMAEKLERYREKGMDGRKLKAMIVGIPNVGKSSLINKICGSKKAKVENRPGVTVDKQWVATNIGLDLMDMPGVLWPKFDDRTTGENLALTGAIKDKVLIIEELAIVLCSRLRKFYPEMLAARYKLGDINNYADYTDLELFELIGKKRGFLISGGEIDYERTANMLLEEFRSAKIGRITLDRI